MRVVKEAEERKKEILDAAAGLFAEKGIDATSTTDILNKVGIARGTLYHHFKSKENIVDAVICRYSDMLLKRAKLEAEDQNVPVNERVVHVVLAMNVSDEQGRQMVEHAHNPQNVQMHVKMQKLIFDGLVPIFTELVQEGIKQGIFVTPYPVEAVEMIIAHVNRAFDHENMCNLTAVQMGQKFRGLIYNVEHLLGAKAGSFDVLMRVLKQMEEEIPYEQSNDTKRY